MPTIFVCYRRSDTDYETTAIAGRLVAHFGRDHVFMDVDTIPAGQDFREVIRNSLGQCDVAIVVIGERWLALDSNSGERRIDNAADYVRLEIETVLGKAIPVIPLLVCGARMPLSTELPATIADLAFRHAVGVRPGRDFDRDIDTLIADISRTVGFQKHTHQNEQGTVREQDRVSRKPDTNAVDDSTLATVLYTPRAALSLSLPNKSPAIPGLNQASWFLALYFCGAITLLLIAYVTFSATIIQQL